MYKTLKECWESYKTNVLNPKLEDWVLEGFEATWYAGARQMMALWVGVEQDFSKPENLAVVNKWKRELDLFLAEHKKGC